MPSSACSRLHRDLHSFPTRRSSDLLHDDLDPGLLTELAAAGPVAGAALPCRPALVGGHAREALEAPEDRHPEHGDDAEEQQQREAEDRKSTRLNSSHSSISYAVFCLFPTPPRSTLFPYTTLFRSPSRRPGSRASH